MRKHILVLLLSGMGLLAAAVPTETLQCDFSRNAKTPPTVQFTIRKNADGWRINFPKAGRYLLNLPNRDRKRLCPLEASVYARCISGKAFVKLNFISNKGKSFSTSGTMIGTKESRAAFAVEGMEKEHLWRPVSIQFDVSAGTEIQLEKLMLSEDRPESEAFRCSVYTDGLLLPVFHDGTLERMKIEIHNGRNEALKRPLLFRFTGLDGKTFAFTREISLAPYESMRIELPEKPPHYGVWYGDAESDGSRLTFAYLPENGLKTPANPEFEFAVDNHWVDADVLEAMRYAGIRAIRSIVGWERVQPSSAGHWDHAVFEARLKQLEEAGIKMRETLVFTPRWAAESNPEKLPFPRNRKPKMEAWENYVRTMVERYGSRVEFFELWNEPDLKGFFRESAEEYIRLCRRAREIAKEINPDCKFSSGGFATMSPSHPNKPAAFHEAVLREAADCFDFHSYHEHGYFPHYQRMVDAYFLPLRRKYNIRIPWLASETSMHSAKGLDVEQADCLFKKLLFTWARGGFSYTWYGLCNNGYDLNYSEDNFGLFDKYMNPKYAFGTYAALIRLYNEARFSGQIQSAGNPWLFAFRTPDSMLLANWSANQNEGSRIYAVSVPGGIDASQLDLDGVPEARPCRNGIALISVNPSGSTLRISGAQSIEAVKPIAELMLPAAVISGRPISGTLRLMNPWNEEISCSLRTDPRIEQDLPRQIELAPLSEQMIPFHFTCKENDRELTVALSFADGPGVKVSAPLNPAKFLPDADFQSRNPDFVLKSYSQIEGNFEFDPVSAAACWQGFDDLSVELWLGRENSSLKLLAKIRDDKFAASPDPKCLWKGDSIQFHLAFAGQDGYFELGAGLTEEEKVKTECWEAPAGFNLAEVQKALKADVARYGIYTVYQITIPLAALGIAPDALKHGFRFNFLANDNDDGKSRKAFIRLAPGIGSSQTIKNAPMVICK